MSRAAVAGLLLLSMLAPAALGADTGPGKKRRPLPNEFGRVVMEPVGEKGKLPPVVFEHWLHRARFTCRLCHVDIGFAMKANGSAVKAADNEAGYFCGACHNGKLVVLGQKVFASCAKVTPTQACHRCHSVGMNVVPEVDFASFTKNLPRGRFGNGVDWEKAEQDKLIHPIDELPGISIKRQPITAQKDFALSPKLEGMPDIIFSHKKHTVWSGCEGCHPDIFVGVKKGVTKYTMVEIFEGKYCGVCHSSVAFPTLDCQRCHVRPVQ
jgi:c(7)-type cytochrome triheme protein